MKDRERGEGRKAWGVADREVGVRPRLDGKKIAEDLKFLFDNVVMTVRRPGAVSDAQLAILQNEVSAAAWRLGELRPELFDPLVSANCFALTAGQVMQLARLVDPREASLHPYQQPGLEMQYREEGPRGAGLYAWTEGSEASPTLLDGHWQQ